MNKSDLANISLLMVEDDLTFSTMLSTWLRKKGFEVCTASSVGAAIKLLRQSEGNAPQLVLSDLRMPDHDGLYLLRWLRTQGMNTPFIIMTSYADVQNAVEAMKLGANDYISKPVQPDLLLQKIGDALSARTQCHTEGAASQPPVVGLPSALPLLHSRLPTPPVTPPHRQGTRALRDIRRPPASYTVWQHSWHPLPCRCSLSAPAARARSMWHTAFMS